MDSEHPACAAVATALAKADSGEILADPLVALTRHIDGCARCTARLAPIKVALSRQALDLALPEAGGAPVRGDDEEVFVLFDGSEGDPPRQLTIVVRRGGPRVWELQVTAEPSVSGVLLVSIGVQSFAGRFREDGTATIAGIPAQALNDRDEVGIEIAILPFGQSRAAR